MPSPVQPVLTKCSFTAVEILEMFKLLDLPVCDDSAAIQAKVKQKRDRYLRDKAGPNQEKWEPANRWFRFVADLENRREELLGQVFQLFSKQCDGMLASMRAMGVNAVNREVRAAMINQARTACQTDLDLAERFVRDYLRANNLKEGGFIGVSHALNRAHKDEKNVLLQADRGMIDIFRADESGLRLGASPEGNTVFQRNAYVVESFDRAENYMLRWASMAGRFRQFVLEVDLSKLYGHDSSGFGIVFGDHWPGAFHEFLLDGRGRSTITRHSPGETEGCWAKPAPSDISCFPQANHGNATNTLKIVHATGVFHTFLNGFHVDTVEDSTVRAGQLGIVLAHGLRVSFSKLRIGGVLDIDGIYDDAFRSFMAFEPKRGRRLMGLIPQRDRRYAEGRQLSSLPWPDRQETILVIVGSEAWHQIHDGAASRILIDAISKHGRGYPDRWATQLTDVAFANLADAGQFATITVGGSVSNKVTGEFERVLPRDPLSDNKVFIHHNLASGDRRVALWGSGAAETHQAVDRFLKSPLFDQFLRVGRPKA